MEKEPKHKKMYGNPPKLEKDENGRPYIKKPEKEKKIARTSDGTEGMPIHEGMPMAARHAMERRDMHSRHEVEHMMHDHANKGDKSEMHARHEKEMKDMHKRHEKEASTGGEMIDKIQKNKGEE